MENIGDYVEYFGVNKFFFVWVIYIEVFLIFLEKVFIFLCFVCVGVFLWLGVVCRFLEEFDGDLDEIFLDEVVFEISFL